MNKRVCKAVAVLAAVILTLCGCQKPAPQPDTDGFTCRATVRYREMDVEGTLTCTEDGKMTLNFTLPKSLYGVTLGFDGKEMSMGLGGMDMTVPAEKIPQSALLICLLRTLSAPHPEATETEEGLVIRGEAEQTPYVLVCDPASGLPRSLSVPNEELEAVFTEVETL